MMVEMERVWISLYGGYAHLRTKPTGHPPTVGTTVGMVSTSQHFQHLH